MATLHFYNVPGHGHVNPSLPLTAELARRGHRVVYFATPRYRFAIEAAGATFAEYTDVGDTFFDPYISNGLRPMRVALALLTAGEKMMPELIARGLQEDPAAILYDGMCPWGYYLAHALKRPAVASLSLLPPIPLAHLLRNWDMLRTMLPLLVRDFSTGLEAIRLSRTMAKRYGAVPLTGPNLLNAPGDLSISYTSAEFVPYSRNLAPSIHLTGWTLNDNGAGNEPALAEVGERRLVYVSLGTINSRSPAFFKLCFEAFAGRDYAVLISTGEKVPPDSLGSRPENVIVRPWVAQSEVLRRASVIVTHGGMGSVHDALVLGLPMLLVPQQEEQAFTAQRVAELGAGILLEGRDVDAATLRTGVERLLTDSRYAQRSATLGASLRAAGGPPRAADLVESLIADRK